jgi:hypothetical protein
VLAVLPFVCAASAVAVVAICRLLGWALWLRFVRDVYRTSGSLEAIGAAAPIAKSFLWPQVPSDPIQSPSHQKSVDGDGVYDDRWADDDAFTSSAGTFGHPQRRSRYS